MKLKDYLKQLQQDTLWDERKSLIFSRIQKHKTRKLLWVKHFLSYKKVFYSLIVVGVTVLVFGEDFFTNTLIDNNIFRVDSLEQNQVMAWNIAEIISFEWEYQIKKGTQIITSKYIQEDNLIILKEKSEMIFKLDDETQGKIIWPAEFIISKDQYANKYKITLLEGSFLRIYNEKIKNTLEVVTNDLTLQQDKEKKVDIQIIKKEKEILVNNQGENLKIIKENKKYQEAKREELIIENNKTVNIKDNDITLLDNDEEIVQYIKDHNLSKTFVIEKKILDSDIIETGSDVNPEYFQDILNEFSWMINPIISWQNETLMGLDIEDQGKKLPTESQNNVLITTFDDFFFNLEMEEIEENISQWRIDKLERNELSLVKEINSIIQEFSLSINSVSSFEDIVNILDPLKEQLEEQYYISPSLLKNIFILKERVIIFIDSIKELKTKHKNLEEIQEMEHWSTDIVTDSDETIEENLSLATLNVDNII